MAATVIAAIAAPAKADSRITLIRAEDLIPIEPIEAPVRRAADAFFEALRSKDKTALAKTMLPDGVIFVHDRRDADNPRTRIVPAGEHLKGWESSPPGTDEYMTYESILVDGTMAHVWGPYVFLLNGKPTHCGVNSMSFAKTEDGWRVSNTSFTMTALNECDILKAPKAPE